MLSALKLPGVRWIVAVFGLEYLFEMGSAVALMVVVYDATNSPMAAAAMLVVKQVVPGIAVGFGGGRLDAFDPRRVLVASYALRVVLFATLAIIGYGAGLFALAFAAGLAGGVARTATRTLLARSASGAAFRAATAVSNVAFGVVALLAPALGALIAGQNAQVALATWSGVALLLAVVATRMPRIDVLSEEERGEPVRHSAVRVGWLIAFGGVITAATAMDSPALLAFSRELHGGVGGYGAILGAWGLGMVFGSVAYGRLMRLNLARVFVGGLVLAAASCLALGLSPSIPVACAFAVLGGAGNGIFWVALQTTVLESAPAGHEARAAGRLEAIASVTPAVGIVAGGIVAVAAGPRLTLIIPGVLLLSLAAAWSVFEQDTVVGRRRRPSESSVGSVERAAEAIA